MRSLELTGKGILGTAGVLVVVLVCVRLGFWQLERRDQRLERNEAIAERLSEEPVRLDGVPRDTSGLTYRRVELVGRLEHDASIVLAGRSYQGAPGGHLLTPLRRADRALLVNRGWLPAPDAASVDFDAVALEGEVRATGVLLPFPDIRLDREPSDSFRRTWFRMDGEAIRAQYPWDVPPLYLLATDRLEARPPSDTARSLPVTLDPPELSAGPHLSYALQWFSFATIFAIGWVVLLVRRDH